mgnify:CR=1 FL=1
MDPKSRNLTTGKDMMKILSNVFFDTNEHKVIQNNMKYEYQIMMNMFLICVFIWVETYIKMIVSFKKTFFFLCPVNKFLMGKFKFFYNFAVKFECKILCSGTGNQLVIL